MAFLEKDVLEREGEALLISDCFFQLGFLFCNKRFEFLAIARAPNG